MKDLSPAEEPARRGGPWQFSLRSLMLVMTACCLLVPVLGPRAALALVVSLSAFLALLLGSVGGLVCVVTLVVAGGQIASGGWNSVTPEVRRQLWEGALVFVTSVVLFVVAMALIWFAAEHPF